MVSQPSKRFLCGARLLGDKRPTRVFPERQSFMLWGLRLGRPTQKILRELDCVVSSWIDSRVSCSWHDCELPSSRNFFECPVLGNALNPSHTTLNESCSVPAGDPVHRWHDYELAFSEFLECPVPSTALRPSHSTLKDSRLEQVGNPFQKEHDCELPFSEFLECPVPGNALHPSHIALNDSCLVLAENPFHMEHDCELLSRNFLRVPFLATPCIRLTAHSAILAWSQRGILFTGGRDVVGTFFDRSNEHLDVSTHNHMLFLAHSELACFRKYGAR